MVKYIAPLDWPAAVARAQASWNSSSETGFGSGDCSAQAASATRAARRQDHADHGHRLLARAGRGKSAPRARRNQSFSSCEPACQSPSTERLIGSRQTMQLLSQSSPRRRAAFLERRCPNSLQIGFIGPRYRKINSGKVLAGHRPTARFLFATVMIATSFGALQEQVEARAGIEPACGDLQSPT